MLAGADAAPLGQPCLQTQPGSPFRLVCGPGCDTPFGSEFTRRGHQGEAVHDPPHLGIRVRGQVHARPGRLALLHCQQFRFGQPAQVAKKSADGGAVAAPGGESQVVGEGFGGRKAFPVFEGLVQPFGIHRDVDHAHILARLGFAPLLAQLVGQGHLAGGQEQRLPAPARATLEGLAGADLVHAIGQQVGHFSSFLRQSLALLIQDQQAIAVGQRDSFQAVGSGAPGFTVDRAAPDTAGGLDAGGLALGGLAKEMKPAALHGQPPQHGRGERTGQGKGQAGVAPGMDAHLPLPVLQGSTHPEGVPQVQGQIGALAGGPLAEGLVRKHEGRAMPADPLHGAGAVGHPHRGEVGHQLLAAGIVGSDPQPAAHQDPGQLRPLAQRQLPGNRLFVGDSVRILPAQAQTPGAGMGVPGLGEHLEGAGELHGLHGGLGPVLVGLALLEEPEAIGVQAERRKAGAGGISAWDWCLLWRNRVFGCWWRHFLDPFGAGHQSAHALIQQPPAVCADPLGLLDLPQEFALAPGRDAGGVVGIPEDLEGFVLSQVKPAGDLDGHAERGLVAVGARDGRSLAGQHLGIGVGSAGLFVGVAVSRGQALGGPHGAGRFREGMPDLLRGISDRLGGDQFDQPMGFPFPVPESRQAHDPGDFAHRRVRPERGKGRLDAFELGFVG